MKLQVVFANEPIGPRVCGVIASNFSLQDNRKSDFKNKVTCKVKALFLAITWVMHTQARTRKHEISRSTVFANERIGSHDCDVCASSFLYKDNGGPF